MLIYLRIRSARSEFLKLQCPYPRHSRGVVSAQVGWEYIMLEKRICNLNLDDNQNNDRNITGIKEQEKQ